MYFPERGDSIKISMMNSAGLDDAIVGGEAAKRLGIRFDLMIHTKLDTGNWNSEALS